MSFRGRKPIPIGGGKSKPTVNKGHTKARSPSAPSSPAPSTTPNKRGERGLPPSGTTQRNSETETNKQKDVKGVSEINGWLDELKKQIEDDEYDIKAFSKAQGGSEESGKYVKTLKDICKRIEDKSQTNKKLLFHVDSLCSKLQAACEELLEVAESSNGQSSMEIKGQAMKQTESPSNENILKAILNADKLINKFKATLGTKAINKKVKETKKSVAVNVAENQGNYKMSLVTEWLNKLKEQIEKCNFDEGTFSKPKTMDGNNDELNRCKNTIEDCCRKLKNQNENRKRYDEGVNSLLTEIKEWNKVKSYDKTEENDMYKGLDGRLQLNERKLEYKSANDELQCLEKELKSWDEIKDIADKKELKGEMGRKIRDIRLKIASQKKQLQSEKGNKGNGRKEKLQQEEAMKHLWKMIHKGKAASSEVTTTKVLDELKEYVTITQRQLEGANEEVKLLLNEIKDWEAVKTVNESKENASEIEKSLREGRVQILEKKFYLKSVKEEVNCLTKELGSWDDVKAVDENIDSKYELAQTIRSNRVKLVTIKKQFKSGKDKDDTIQNTFRNTQQVIKEVLTLILPERETSNKAEEVTVERTLDELRKYVIKAQKQSDELERIEKVSRKLEEECHKMYSKLCGGKKLDVKNVETSTDMLNSTLKILEGCIPEANFCLEAIRQLEEVLDIGNNTGNTSISKRCKSAVQKVQEWQRTYKNMKRKLDDKLQSVQMSLTGLLEEPYCFRRPKIDEKSFSQTLPRWLRDFDIIVESLDLCIQENKDRFQQIFVSREQFDRLVKEKARINDQIRELKADKDSAYNRLSKFAGARLTENNSNIADLSDSNRPTKLAEQYSELYDSPWTDAFEMLNKNKEEEECIRFLLEIIVECYEFCGELSKNHQVFLKSAVCFPDDDIESTPASKKANSKKVNSISFSAVQSKALSELRKQTADISVDNVKSLLKSQHKEWFKSTPLEKYSIQCIQLCWLMHVQTPPVVIEMKAKSGVQFDTNRYRQYTKAGKKVDFVVWPVLLLEENGAILCKGVAQGK